MNVIVEVFVANVKRVMKEKRITQTDLAESMGTSRPHINRILQGHTEPGLNTVERFAEALQVPTLSLLLPIEKKIPIAT